ncbi:MAG: hypothetical protein M3256_24160 [Actinomycetota bacterium]|nr:hypothetical protein [Actinomycetota bacterium]
MTIRLASPPSGVGDTVTAQLVDEPRRGELAIEAGAAFHEDVLGAATGQGSQGPGGVDVLFARDDHVGHLLGSAPVARPGCGHGDHDRALLGVDEEG